MRQIIPTAELSVKTVTADRYFTGLTRNTFLLVATVVFVVVTIETTIAAAGTKTARRSNPGVDYVINTHE
jgi:hypothetical protein